MKKIEHGKYRSPKIGDRISTWFHHLPGTLIEGKFKVTMLIENSQDLEQARKLIAMRNRWELEPEL